MLTAAVILFVSIILIDLIHYGALFIFLQKIQHHSPQRKQEVTAARNTNAGSNPAFACAAGYDEFTPKTMVCLALRGADPFLKRCITGLLTQDYPNYSVRIIVDSPKDSSLPIVKEIAGNSSNVEIITVDEHYETCTLKVNSLVRTLQTLDPSYEVVAVCDADTNPHAAWLRDLVQPLADPQIAATSGQRWYIPDEPNAASLVRYLWNAAAVVQLVLYKMLWGGSMALRRDLLELVKDDWKTAFTDDLSVASALKRLGCQAAFVPTLFMVNRETTTFASFHRWVKRQLLCAKLHHPAWNNVAVQGLLINVPLLAALALLIAGLVCGDAAVALWSAASLTAYWLGVYGTLPIIENSIRKLLKQRGEPLKPWGMKRTLLTLLMIPITQIVYTSALIRLYFVKRVEWRGVEYEIRGKSIHLVEYKPYTTKPEDELQSVL
jgi:glycosyltransferase involved in cell wall biosynthesis